MEFSSGNRHLSLRIESYQFLDGQCDSDRNWFDDSLRHHCTGSVLEFHQSLRADMGYSTPFSIIRSITLPMSPFQVLSFHINTS